MLLLMMMSVLLLLLLILMLILVRLEFVRILIGAIVDWTIRVAYWQAGIPGCFIQNVIVVVVNDRLFVSGVTNQTVVVKIIYHRIRVKAIVEIVVAHIGVE